MIPLPRTPESALGYAERDIAQPPEKGARLWHPTPQ